MSAIVRSQIKYHRDGVVFATNFHGQVVGMTGVRFIPARADGRPYRSVKPQKPSLRRQRQEALKAALATL
jgi:hypothetical protein